MALLNFHFFMLILLNSAIHSEFCFIHNIFAFWNSVEFLIRYLNLIPCQKLYDYFDPFLLHFDRHFQCFPCEGTNIFLVHICTHTQRQRWVGGWTITYESYLSFEIKLIWFVNLHLILAKFSNLFNNNVLHQFISSKDLLKCTATNIIEMLP